MGEDSAGVCLRVLEDEKGFFENRRKVSLMRVVECIER
jgi:hypothetical protein